MPVEQIGLSINGLTKYFGTVCALDALKLETGNDWKCLGVVGRNAAGKTTLLRIVVGLLEKDRGSVQVRFGSGLHDFADPQRAVFIGEVSLLPESLYGNEYLDYLEALNNSLGVLVDHELRTHLVDRLALSDQLTKRISKMSKGTKRKLELVGAIAACVPLIVADELCAGLDVPSMEVVADVIREATDKGARFVISSHDVSFMTAIADMVAVIDHGQCVDLFLMAEVADNAVDRIRGAFR